MLQFIGNRFTQLKNIPFYPLLFGSYPVLALLGHNIVQVELSVIWHPLFACIAGVLIVFLVLRWLLRGWHKAALGTVLLVFLFFTYGHVYGYFKSLSTTIPMYLRHRFLVPTWIGLAALGLWWLVRKVKHPHSHAAMLNMLSVLMLIYPLFKVGSFVASQNRGLESILSASNTAADLHLTSQSPPDIYYIILDSYPRSDLLRDRFNYDNSKFLDALRAEGFYIADCSQSNYTETLLSLASTLNMNYLETLGKEFISGGGGGLADLVPWIQQSVVRKDLESLGYRTVSIESGFVWTEWHDADYYLSQPVGGLQLNEFEAMLMQTSAGRVVMDAAALAPEKQAAEIHRQRILYELYELKYYIPSIRGPKFAFVHLVIPHSPFVFGPNGEAIEPITFPVKYLPTFEEYASGYIDEVNYINSQMLQVVDEILKHSATPPIIIIQGDHGAWMGPEEYNSVYNLSAYYLPGEAGGLYKTITPVNTFRLIINNYFGGNLEILDDISRWSGFEAPFDFTVVKNQCSQ